jgi:hypothetical protein
VYKVTYPALGNDEDSDLNILITCEVGFFGCILNKSAFIDLAILNQSLFCCVLSSSSQNSINERHIKP